MIEIKVDEERAPFRPVSITLTFKTAEELNAFADFMVAAGSKARTILEDKQTRRLPKMYSWNARDTVIRPFVAVLKKLTPRPTSR